MKKNQQFRAAYGHASVKAIVVRQRTWTWVASKESQHAGDATSYRQNFYPATAF